ncbi:hypothetical protein NE237_005194 [Protea cynaroides]|uniref:Guanylate kinase-like domain-containing protein n=1 Tax=Protea cynaroides TaxID=273540 RepID=A0A9Q0KKE3_9MAGN|nr:hypothetical protein NE237_005194 [Protea cynaroides]
MIERNELLEYALVYGDYKGIPKQQIRDFMAKGFDIVLRVDIQGAATLRSILGKSAVFIFLVAESESALVKRLIDRKTETTETLLVRIATAREEVKHLKEFDYVVVNAEGKLDSAFVQWLLVSLTGGPAIFTLKVGKMVYHTDLNDGQ